VAAVSAPPLGVAVIGLGVGARHLAAYAAHPECRVVAVCDRQGDLARRAAAAHPGAVALTDALDAVHHPGVDVVSVASHDADHAGQALAALHAGRHVFAEKPLCTTVAEARALAAAARARPGAVVASNLVLRAAPVYRELRRMVAAGELGTPYSVDGEYLYGRLHKLTEGWRGRAPGYSPTLGGAVHLVDLMCWITGRVPERVVAVGGDVCSRGTGYAGDDYVAAMYALGDGLVGRVTANFGSVTRHHHVLRVYGTAGTAIVDDDGPRLHTARDPGGPVARPGLAVLPADKGALIPAFVDACLGRPTWLPGAGHELAVVMACWAADESRRTGTWVDVPRV
jgi:predicted dehydrogenase